VVGTVHGYFRRHRLQPETDASAARVGDLWDHRLSGRITMLDDPFDVFRAWFEEAGYSINAMIRHSSGKRRTRPSRRSRCYGRI